MALSSFITTKPAGIRGVRVIPITTDLEDLAMFRLIPGETLSVFEYKGRKYVELISKVPANQWEVKLRLDAISSYLKALYQ
ncbi:hypothetical protein [Belliella aquatica]|uniref:Uncharacterized protein n=1 Tax=Belliella aquatica TaxID=1323734 RepID=A0ABQ1M672_9BACT|nr:hypothetical protein [Belliella aquatica]MCH7404629.1 hypothetical protein [Belliella aquatica]GGC35390.1 hypothetical protein GCM10010993_12880 [Belliella aquatica]